MWFLLEVFVGGLAADTGSMNLHVDLIKAASNTSPRGPVSGTASAAGVSARRRRRFSRELLRRCRGYLGRMGPPLPLLAWPPLVPPLVPPPVPPLPPTPPLPPAPPPVGQVDTLIVTVSPRLARAPPIGCPRRL